VCIRQADRIILCSADPEPPPARPEIPADTVVDVVLTGTAPTPAQITRWHDVVTPRRVYTGSSAEALRPLAARIAGRAVGLALSGGGARAFAHIGVLDSLLEAGLEIDRVSACSIGAVVGSLYAGGLTPDAIDAVCFDGFVRSNPLGDFTLPTRSLSRGRRTQRGLERVFGDLRIEALPREFACVSTDLYRRRLVVHRRGSVADAVGASLSLPGLLPPRTANGSVLVDGGVLENLPTSPLTAYDEGPVIGVNIGFGSGRTSPVTGDRLRVPGLGETLLRLVLMAGAAGHEAAARSATVVVTPDTRGVGLLEWHQIDRLREAGRVAGREAAAALSAATSP